MGQRSDTVVTLECDQCGKEEVQADPMMGTPGWINLTTSVPLLFCSWACVGVYADEQAGEDEEVPSGARR